MAQILFQGKPTAQIDFEYTPVIDTPVVVYFTGSAYSKKAGVEIGYKLFISGQLVATTFMYSNSPQTHRALNPSMVYHTFPIAIDNGNVVPIPIRIEPISGDTLFDVNDQVTLAIL